jgi:TIGR03009 family protein
MNAPIMRKNFRLSFAFLTAFSMLGIPAMLPAQQGKKPASSPTGSTSTPAGKASTGKPPAAKPTADTPAVRPDKKRIVIEEEKVDKVDPELEKLLARWETESAKIKSLSGKHTKREFNKSFEVEKVSEGEFFLQTPDKGRIDIVPVVPKKGEKSKRNGYTLEPGSSERWICTGEEIYSINDVEKTYIREELPPNLRGKNIVHSPLPFLFGMKAEDAKHRFNIELMSVDTEKETATLKIIPRMDNDRQNYHEAWIILSTKQYIPKGVRLFDPNGLETIYMFNDVTINDGNFLQKIGARFRGDPYKPNLKDYKREIPREVEPASAREGSGANPTRQALGTGTPKRDADKAASPRPQQTRSAAGPQPAKK